MTTTYSEIYNRIMQEELDLKAKKREQRKQVYDDVSGVLRDVKDNVAKPIGYVAWETAKALGRGIKATAKGAKNVASYAVDVYSNYQNYCDMEAKVTGIDPRTASSPLEAKLNAAEAELKAASRAASNATRESERNKKSKTKDKAAKAAYQTEQTKYAEYTKAKTEYKAQAGGVFTRCILKPLAKARTYEFFESLTKGTEITPLQMYSLFRGFPDKFTEFKKPKDKKKTLFTSPIYNPFTNEPFKDKDGKDINREWTDMKDFTEYAGWVIGEKFKQEEFKFKWEQMKSNPLYGFANMGGMNGNPYFGMGGFPGFGGFNPNMYGGFPFGSGFNQNQNQNTQNTANANQKTYNTTAEEKK